MNYKTTLMTLAIFCFVVSFQVEADEIMSVESGVADYNGKTIVFTGNVIVEHELGTLSANEMMLTPLDDSNRINFLKLQHNVKIALKNGGELTCGIANVNYSLLQGDFIGENDKDFVTYTEQCRDKAESGTSIVVKSRRMLMHFMRKENEHRKTPHNAIQDILAERDVTVSYNNDFIATSDQASYQRHPNLLKAEFPIAKTHLPGLISLRRSAQNGICQVTNLNGDFISAEAIDIDTVHRKLFFTMPKGLLMVSEGEKRDQIDFSGNTMTWDDLQRTLTLRDDVIIYREGMGQLATDKEVNFFQKDINGKNQFHEIETSGTTVITFLDDTNTHTLTCYGQATMDLQKNQTVMKSPLDPSGKVIDGKQVFFQDHLGEIYADTMTINYTKTEGGFSPDKLILLGHVHILNRGPEATETGSFIQYALADKVEYTPDTKEITLSADQSKRILFLDKLNNLQVSAPALKIKRDKTTNKDSIQGVGDVRFNFIKQEVEELYKQFQIGDVKEP